MQVDVSAANADSETPHGAGGSRRIDLAGDDEPVPSVRAGSRSARSGRVRHQYSNMRPDQDTRPSLPDASAAGRVNLARWCVAPSDRDEAREPRFRREEVVVVRRRGPVAAGTRSRKLALLVVGSGSPSLHSPPPCAQRGETAGERRRRLGARRTTRGLRVSDSIRARELPERRLAAIGNGWPGKDLRVTPSCPASRRRLLEVRARG